jgi:diacylglycerol O-acyltransferase
MNVSAADVCFWSLDSPTSRQAISLFHLLDQQPDRAVLIARLDAACKRFPKLNYRRKPLPSSAWELDPVFTLENHLQWKQLTSTDSKAGEVNAEEVGDTFKSAAELEFSRELPVEHPLWKIVVFTHDTLPGAALLYVIHHSVADGISGMALFYSLCDAITPQRSSTEPQQRTFRRALPWGFSHPVASIRRILADGLAAPHQNSLHGINSAARRIESRQYALPLLAPLRKRFSLSVNECYLLMVTRGLQALLADSSPGQLQCAALVPVNLRADIDFDQLGNQLTAVRILLPVDEPRMEEQAKRIKRELTRVQTDGSIGAYQLLSSILARMPLFLRQKFLWAAARRIECICTNAPGPRKPQGIAGARILSTDGIPALLPSQGLGFAAVRYTRSLSLCAVYDPAILSKITPFFDAVDLALTTVGDDEL